MVWYDNVHSFLRSITRRYSSPSWMRHLEYDCFCVIYQNLIYLVNSSSIIEWALGKDCRISWLYDCHYVIVLLFVCKSIVCFWHFCEKQHRAKLGHYVYFTIKLQVCRFFRIFLQVRQFTIFMLVGNISAFATVALRRVWMRRLLWLLLYASVAVGISINVSSKTGLDTLACITTPSSPCKTISYAVSAAAWACSFVFPRRPDCFRWAWADWTSNILVARDDNSH